MRFSRWVPGAAAIWAAVWSLTGWFQSAFPLSTIARRRGASRPLLDSRQPGQVCDSGREVPSLPHA
jgi:hypothetical protein